MRSGNSYRRLSFIWRTAVPLLVSTCRRTHFSIPDYDRAAGQHSRRYTRRIVWRKVAEESEVSKVKSYNLLGAPAGPAPPGTQSHAYATERWQGWNGYQGGHGQRHRLAALARCEPLPQKFLGTSVMAVLENDREGISK